MRKEIAATAIFAVAGLVGTLVSGHPWPARIPNALFYAVLVLNTYFSIRFFGGLPPADRNEAVIDGVLAILYFALALAIGWNLAFALASSLLFAAAMLKYVLLLRLIDRTILVRKIAIDGAGFLLCAATLAGCYFGYALESAWLQALVFGLANVYLLAIRPMYA
ncbi:MAG: hypothetical protein WD036_08550 [Bauldia sp.]